MHNFLFLATIILSCFSWQEVHSMVTAISPFHAQKMLTTERSFQLNAITNARQSYTWKDKERPAKSKESKDVKYVHPQVLKMFQRATYLMKIGDNIVAKKLLRRCIELHPQDAHSWLALARLEAKTGHIEEAKQTFQLACQQFPTNVHILHSWGHFEQKYGKLEVARECWSKARAIEPLNAYVAHALSALELRLGNHDISREILLDIVRKRPTPALCVMLSEQERRRGNMEEARQILLDGLKRCRQNRSQIYLSLAWLEENVFRSLDAALEYIQSALEEDKNENVRAFIAKASLELRNNQVEKAKETLETACSVNSEDGQAYTMWSTIELESGNIEKARTVIEEGAKKFPGDQFLLQRWGSFEAKYGNSSKARELFERSVIIQPHAPTFVAWALLEESEGMKAMKTSDDSENSRIISSIYSYEGLEDILVDDELPLLPVVSPAVPSAVLQEKLSLARKLLDIGLEVDPLHGPVYHAYGNLELRHNNISGARSIFWKGILNNCTEIVSVYHALGMLEQKQNNIDTAKKILQTGISIALQVNGLASLGSQPEEVYANLLLGLNARTDSAPTNSLSPNSYNHEIYSGLRFLLHTLGMLEYDLGQYKLAKQIFMTGNKLYPHQTQILLGLALVHMKLGEAKQAKQYFKAAVTTDTRHSHAWQAWAVYEKSLQNYELARMLFKEGLKYDPAHGALWQAYAVMEMQLGNMDVARSLLKESIARCPSHAQSYQALACLEVKANNLNAAYAVVYEGIRRSGGFHAAMWTIAGLVEDRLGNRRKAKELLEKAIERFPRHGALYKVLGEIEVREGNVEAARHWFNEGLERDPFYAATYHAAALLEARIGNLVNLSGLHYRAKKLFNHSQKSLEDEVLKVRPEVQQQQQQQEQAVYDRINELQEAAQSTPHPHYSDDQVISKQYLSQQEDFINHLATS